MSGLTAFVVVTFLFTSTMFTSNWVINSRLVKLEGAIGENFPAQLRCHNAPTPRAWSKTDAEAALLYAQASLDAARNYSGSPQHKSAFALESIAASLLVERCWR